MKTRLLFLFTIVLAISLSAQKMPSMNHALNNIKDVRSHQAVENTMNFSAGFNASAITSSRATLEDPYLPIGTTRYDLQSNSAMPNRLYVHKDGTMGATFTFGKANPSYADRGTGYVYFNGTEWSPEPTERIEAIRTGWPSYCPLGENGEIVVAHGASKLIISKRATKGTGAWEYSEIVAPSGGNSLTWPRMCTNGNSIHIIACTDQQTPYQGLKCALVYSRSTDGGATWDKSNIILPGMTAAELPLNGNYKGIGGDSYGWAQPKGDTIAFVVSDEWGGTFVMKSFDNGENWTKVPVTIFPTIDPVAAVGVKFPTTDGFASVALDNTGKAHVTFGRMAVSDDNFGDDASSYYPYFDGLLYWNETMPPMDTTRIGMVQVDSLEAHGQIIGWMLDLNNNGEIDWPTPGASCIPMGKYFCSGSSMPVIDIDKDNNIYVVFSSLIESQINQASTQAPTQGAALVTTPQMYRHIFMTKKYNNESKFGDPVDLTSEHFYDECVFPSMMVSHDGANVHMIYQYDGEPGLSVRGDEDAATTNTIAYKTPVATGVNVKPAVEIQDVKVYPNPVSTQALLNVVLNKASNISLDVYNVQGQKVMSSNFGKFNAGTQRFDVNTSSLVAGVYFFKVNVNNSSSTVKVLVK